jgi:peptidoglycan-associated lipoprotein
MRARSFVLPILATSFLCIAGCAKKDTVSVAQGPLPPPISAAAAPVALPTPGRNIGISTDIARACGIKFNDPDKAPKFDFDQSALMPADRAVLDQVAACVTRGPLKGRDLNLVGRADPRGEAEYNMALGEHRAGSAWRYLTALGVDKGKLAETSRGKLDATGSDEQGWARDRRVDILLR